MHHTFFSLALRLSPPSFLNTGRRFSLLSSCRVVFYWRWAAKHPLHYPLHSSTYLTPLPPPSHSHLFLASTHTPLQRKYLPPWSPSSSLLSTRFTWLRPAPGNGSDIKPFEHPSPQRSCLSTSLFNLTSICTSLPLLGHLVILKDLLFPHSE